MIYVDGSEVKVDGVVLPGLFKSLEIAQDAQIDEETIEGSTSKPKQATGYEDAKITLELTLDDGPSLTKEQKLTQIQNLFKVKSQGIPIVRQIVNTHTAIRGIDKILFKNLTSKETNGSSTMTASMEFWQYDAAKITATKASTTSSSSKKAISSKKASSSSASGLSASYQSYLKSDRGKAPTVSDKTAGTPAKDTASPAAARNKLGGFPYSS